jgi:hypothetical protein
LFVISFAEMSMKDIGPFWNAAVQFLIF